MRSAPASIQTMLQGTQGTLARCAKFVLRDGTQIGFTDHDRDLAVPLFNDTSDGALSYLAGYGMIVGDMVLQIGLDADNTEASFPISEMISREAVLARRFNNAECYLFDIDWTQTSPEPLELMAGYVADSRIDRYLAVFEIRSQADRWNTVIGSILSPRCRADFGDVKCGATVTNYPATVTTALSNLRFEIDVTGHPDDFFRFGEVEFLTGELGATWPYEVIAYNGTSGEVEVLSPMPGFPQVGDQLLIRDGCSKLKTSTYSVPTCFTHNNVLRFRGWDQVPGSDHFLRFPIPGDPGA